MKITMYELLGLVKDGKAPKKIKYDGQEYKITKVLLEDNNYYFNYINEDMECILPINTNHLNDEVEILEEEKKIPKKIDVIAYEKCIHEVTHKEKQLALEIRDIQIAFNEIIDYLKSKGE